MPAQPAIDTVVRLANARRSYGDVRALDGFNLQLAPGQVLALLGANGAGKSTAIGLLLGLLKADSGEVAVLGGLPSQIAVRRRIGVMLQSAALPDASTVAELLQVTRACYPAPLDEAECVRMAGLDGLMQRRYGRLSGGQQRRVQFALAICGDPQLLFLDEPTTGLDIEARRGIWQAIDDLRRRGTAALLTTHYLEEAEALADRVVVIDKGRVLVEGSVEAIRARIASQRIRCRSVLDTGALALWPGVHAARREGERLTLTVDKGTAVLARLLAADPALSELEVTRAGLADAFLALTGAHENVTH